MASTIISDRDSKRLREAAIAMASQLWKDKRPRHEAEHDSKRLRVLKQGMACSLAKCISASQKTISKQSCNARPLFHTQWGHRELVCVCWSPHMTSRTMNSYISMPASGCLFSRAAHIKQQRAHRFHKKTSWPGPYGHEGCLLCTTAQACIFGIS